MIDFNHLDQTKRNWGAQINHGERGDHVEADLY